MTTEMNNVEKKSVKRMLPFYTNSKLAMTVAVAGVPDCVCTKSTRCNEVAATVCVISDAVVAALVMVAVIVVATLLINTVSVRVVTPPGAADEKTNKLRIVFALVMTMDAFGNVEVLPNRK
jgi:hypothetical protein